MGQEKHAKKRNMFVVRASARFRVTGYGLKAALRTPHFIPLKCYVQGRRQSSSSILRRRWKPKIDDDEDDDEHEKRHSQFPKLVASTSASPGRSDGREPGPDKIVYVMCNKSIDILTLFVYTALAYSAKGGSRWPGSGPAAGGGNPEPRPGLAKWHPGMIRGNTSAE